MKKSLLMYLVLCGVILSCAGQRAHIQWAPNLSQGLTKAKTLNKPEKIELPEAKLGFVMVVDTEPEKSTALVIHSDKEFHNGSIARGIDWSEVREILSRVPRCDVQNP